MASSAYPLGIQAIMGADIDLLADTIKCRISRTSAYTFSTAHQFASSLAAAIGTDATLGSKATNGAGSSPGSFDAADATYTAVAAGAAINSCEIYKDTGVAGTSPLVLYLDGFSVTPNGGDITLQWASAAPFIWTIAP
jgi:hypothetical protein